MKDTFQNRLKEAIRFRNIKPVELSEKTGISESLISKYLSGKAIARQNKLFKLAIALDVSESWLMGYESPMVREKISFKDSLLYMCPVYGKISAGQPNWIEECIEGRIPIDPDMMNIHNPEDCFFLRVNGESMNKEIKNGGFALIKKTDFVENGEIAVVLVNGFDATLKKFTKQGDLIILEPMSTDSSFETQVYDKNTEVKVIGKYIGKMEMK